MVKLIPNEMEFNFKQIGALVLIIGAIMLWFIPEQRLLADHQNHSLCLVKRLIDMDCPGCGLTRGIYAILHLQFKKSIHYHLAAPIFLLLLIGECLSAYRPRLNSLAKLNNIIYYLFASAILINYTYKIINHQLFI